MTGAELLDEAALPEAPVALDDNDAALGGFSRCERRIELLHLRSAADEGQVRPHLRVDPLCGTDGVRLHRLGFALDVERRHDLGGEQRLGTVEHAGGREDGAWRRGRHQPRRQVDGVAHDGERPPELRSDLARKDVAAIDADLHAEAKRSVSDATQGAQHASLVVVARGRHPGDEDDLAAVVVEVAREERDPLGVDRRLDRGDGLVENSRRRLRSFVGEQIVHALVFDEGDRRQTVLGFDGRRPEVGAQTERQSHRDRVSWHLPASATGPGRR